MAIDKEIPIRDGTVVILGAGAAGISCAYGLAKGGKPSRLVEREDAIGGLARTLVFERGGKAFRTDIGPHRFFSKDRSLYAMIERLLGERWISVDRLTHFYVGGKLYRYPLKLGEALRNLGIAAAGRALFDFLAARARIMFSPRDPANFEQYAIDNFGEALARFNLLNYTEKIWGIPCSQISADWATQRIEGLSVRALLKKAIAGSKGPKTLVDRFSYPDTGAGLLYETMLEAAAEAGTEALLSARPSRIKAEGSSIKSVELEDGRCFEPSALVSSMPITDLVEIIDPAPPSQVLDAARRLRFRAQMHLFIMLDRERVGRDQWYYYPERDIPFGRISEMKNFSPRMAPEGMTSLTVEFFVFKGDEIWIMPETRLAELAVDWMKRVGLDDGGGIVDTHIHREEHAYPIYEIGYEKRLETIKSWLDRFDNLLLVGRCGRFRYTNQDHSMSMGLAAARSILEGRRHDIEAAGAEREYYERGEAEDARSDREEA